MMWLDLNRSTKSQKFWFYIDIWIIKIRSLLSIVVVWHQITKFNFF